MNETELTALPVLECTQVPVIVENLMDMAASYQAKLDYINTLPRDDEGMKAVKALRAEARKEFEELDTKRKEVKQKVMGPYNKAETIFKSFVTTPFNSLDKACKEFSDSVEGEMKARCEAQLQEYFAELCAMKGIHWLPWERMGIKVDMATARLKEPKKAMETVKGKVEKICADLDTISQEFKGDAAEYLAAYESCLDVSESIRRVNSRKEAQRIAEENRVQREARQAQTAQIRQAMPEVGTVVMPQAEKQCVTVWRLTGTISCLRAMKAQAERLGVKLEEVN